MYATYNIIHLISNKVKYTYSKYINVYRLMLIVISQFIYIYIYMFYLYLKKAIEMVPKNEKL